MLALETSVAPVVDSVLRQTQWPGKPDFVLVALCEKNTYTQNLSDALSEKARLDKVIAVSSKNLGERLGTCQQEALSIEQMTSRCQQILHVSLAEACLLQISYEAIIRDLICPSPHRDARRFTCDRRPLPIEERISLSK